MKRRLTLYGAGFALGLPIAIALFQYASMVQKTTPRETRSVEVVMTKCALKDGDVFKPECVEKRVVAEQFVPPDVIPADQVGLWTGKTIHAKLEVGSAVRTVDFQTPE